MGEIANFTDMVSVEKEKMVFNWPSSFLTKNERNSWTSSLPFITELRSPDLNLCPVRAVRIYLDRKSSFSSTSSRNGMFWPKPQSSLSRLLVQAIKEGFKRAGIDIPDKIGIHQIRKLSVSLCFNEFQGVENKATVLPRNVGSKSMAVLKRVYIGPVSKPSWPMVLPLGTLDI